VIGAFSNHPFGAKYMGAMIAIGTGEDGHILNHAEDLARTQ